jgi:hypothetical protein
MSNGKTLALVQTNLRRPTVSAYDPRVVEELRAEVATQRTRAEVAERRAEDVAATLAAVCAEVDAAGDPALAKLCEAAIACVNVEAGAASLLHTAAATHDEHTIAFAENRAEQWRCEALGKLLVAALAYGRGRR